MATPEQINQLIDDLSRSTYSMRMARGMLPTRTKALTPQDRSAITRYENASAEIEAIVHEFVHSHPADCC